MNGYFFGLLSRTQLLLGDGNAPGFFKTVDNVSQKQQEARAGSVKPVPDQKSATPASAAPATEFMAPEAPTPAIIGCPPATIAEVWLGRFDRAIARRDIKTILGLFAPDIVAKATVRSGDGTATVEFDRDEFVQSTLSSIAGLKDYQQRRVSLEASFLQQPRHSFEFAQVTADQGQALATCMRGDMQIVEAMR